MVRIDKPTGAATVLTTTTATPVAAMTAAGDSLFWAGSEGSVASAPIAGGVPTVLAATGASGSASIAVTGGHVYVPSTVADPTHTVLAVSAIPTAGGSPTVVWKLDLGQGPPEPGPLLPTWVSWWPGGVAVLAGTVRDLGQHAGELSTITAKGAVADVVKGLAWTSGLAVAGSDAFYTSCAGPSLETVPLGGGTAVALAALPESLDAHGWPCEYSGLAADAASVYVIAAAKLLRIRRADGSVTVIADAPGTGRDTRLVVDDCAVYWVGPDGVMRAGTSS